MNQLLLWLKKIATLGELKKWINTHHKKFIFIMVFVLIFVFFLSGLILGRKSYILDQIIAPPNSYIGKVQTLRRSYVKYKSMNKEELHISWLEFLKDYKYSRGGDPLMGYLDCLRAMVMFLKAQGAGIEIADISELVNRFVSLNRVGYADINKPAKTGDIVVFKSVNGVPHIGLVEEMIPAGIIKYMDFNGVTGVGYQAIQVRDYRIWMIVELSFPVWAGQKLK